MRRTVVAAAHAAPILLDARASVARACELVREAGRMGVRLLVFPETFVPGFPYWLNLYPPIRQYPAHQRYQAASVRVPGEELAPLQAAAREARVNVVLGASERDGHTCYNVQVFVGEDGAYLGKHRKLQPTFAERTLWGQGDGSTLLTFPTTAGVVGGLICYEHSMNLARHALILQGLEVHCASWPTFATFRGREGWFDQAVDALSRAHAISGQCFVVVAENPVTRQMLDVLDRELGPQDVLGEGGGWSAVFSPDGLPLAGPHVGPEERIVAAEIDLDEIARSKLRGDSAGHYARAEVLRLAIDAEPKTPLLGPAPARPAPVPFAAPPAGPDGS